MLHRITLALVFLAHPLLAQETIRMRIAHPNGPTHHMGRALTLFAEDVNRASGGTIMVEQTSEGGSPFGALPIVKSGTLEAAGIANFYWPSPELSGVTHPVVELNATLIPYQLTDIDKLKRFPTSEAAAFFNSKIAANGVRPLMWLFITNTNVYASVSRPLIQPSDFDGLRMRSLVGITQDVFEILGATPFTMSPGRVNDWIRRGEGDGATSDISAASGMKWWETQPYATVANVYSVFYVIFVNNEWWHGLSSSHRQAIETAARQAERTIFDIAADRVAQSPYQKGARGMNVHIQTDEERQLWHDALVEPVTQKFLTMSPDAQKTLDLLNGL